jgi:hypothetical protein
MVRYNYNRQVEPPAPFVHVVLTRPDGSGPPVEWPAQLDSGADRTVIPTEVTQMMTLAETGLMRVAGLGGEPQPMPVYLVQLAVRGLRQAHVEVISVPGEAYVLLGRDVLNRHRVLLDGPSLSVTIEEG